MKTTIQHTLLTFAVTAGALLGGGTASWARSVEFNACNPAAISQNGTTVRALGMYNISPNGDFNRYVSSNGMNCWFGGTLGDKIFYEIRSTSLTNPTMAMMQKWNYPAYTRNGGMLSVPNKIECLSVTQAYNPVDKLIYGCFYNSGKTGWEFGSFNPDAFNTNMTRPVIKVLDKKWNAMAINGKGEIYAIDEDGDLHKVDAATGAMTRIGSTGLRPTKQGSAAFDMKIGDLFWSVVTADGAKIYSIDLATGTASPVLALPYGEQLQGLHIYRPDCPDAAPAYVDNLKFTFEGVSTSGKAEFTMPTILYDGTKASGNASYAININGKTVASGNAAYGEKVSVNIEAGAEGQLPVEVTASNAAGTGPANKTMLRLGYGTPASPTGFMVSHDGSKFSLRWNAVTTSADGCFIEPDKITYTVTRAPGDVVVAKDITATTLTDPIPVPETPKYYTYSVTANYHGHSSAPAVSPVQRLGSFTPPYSNTFDTASDAETFIVINSNNDVYEFRWAAGAMMLPASKTMNMNDWLITPPVKMEKGKAYILNIDAQGVYVNVKEKFEVKAGTEPTAAAMKTTVVAAKEVVLESEPTTGIFRPTADGIYHIGIHATTTKGSAALNISAISISEGLAVKAPCAVTSLKAVPAADGSHKATVSFIAPAKALDMSPLTAISKIEVYRGDKLVKTFDAPAKETPLEYTDALESAGNVTYTVVPYTEAGKGETSSVSVYVGVNTPGAPSGVTAVETDTEGTVYVTWQAPAVSADGFPMDPSLISYNLYSVAGGKKELVASGIKDTFYTHKAIEAGGSQQFMQYGVMGVTEKGEGPGAVSSLVAVGTSYKMPFTESFAYGSPSHIFGTEIVNGTSPEVIYWQQCTSGDINKYMASDDDNGFIAHYAKYTGQGGRLFTGKIKVEAEHPVLWLSTYSITADDKNILDVEVREPGAEWKKVNTSVVNDLSENQKAWGRLVIDLSEYKGKTVQLGFSFTTKSFAWSLLDDLRLYDAKGNDLALVTMAAPLVTPSGTSYAVECKVENAGSKESGSYTVNATFNGEKVATADGTALLPGKNRMATLVFDIPVNAADINTLKVTVDNAGDENAADNSREAEVAIANGDMPAVANLKAEKNDDRVLVSWEAPALSGVPAQTEGFEGMASWTTPGNAGWSFVDADNAPVTGITGLELPNIAINSRQSWWVMDRNLDAIKDEVDFRAKSGDKFMASMATANGTSSDDWAITPQLCGKAQSVAFWARSFHGRYPETFEVLYSKGSNKPADFVSLAKVENIPYAWTQYSFQLPADTRYAAVRKISPRGFMLYIDDFSYTGTETEALTLRGYHVAADGKVLTEQPVADMTYSLPATASKIAVWPVFDKGVGAMSEVAVSTGIDGIDADAAGQVRYFNLQGFEIAAPRNGEPAIMMTGNKIVKIIGK